jgi:hypothetical protein
VENKERLNQMLLGLSYLTASLLPAFMLVALVRAHSEVDLFFYTMIVYSVFSFLIGSLLVLAGNGGVLLFRLLYVMAVLLVAVDVCVLEYEMLTVYNIKTYIPLPLIPLSIHGFLFYEFVKIYRIKFPPKDIEETEDDKA